MKVRSTLILAMGLGVAILATARPASAEVFTCDGAGDEAWCSMTIQSDLAIEVRAGDLLEGDDAHNLYGEVRLVNPVVDLVLRRSQLILARDAHGSWQLHGIAEGPIFDLPLFAGADVHSHPLAAVGLSTRATLESLFEGNELLPKSGPLHEASYLYFHYDTGLAFDLSLSPLVGHEVEEGEDDPLMLSPVGSETVTFIQNIDDENFYTFYSTETSASLGDELKEWVQGEEEEGAETDGDRDGNAEGESGTDGEKADGTDGTESDGDSADGEGADGEGQDGDGDSAGDKAKAVLDAISVFALSENGDLPYVPATTFGIEKYRDDIPFYGDLYLKGTIPVYGLIEIEGEVVSWVGEEGAQMAGNGEVVVGLPFFHQMSLTLGRASAGMKVADPQRSDEAFQVFFSGIQKEESNFLPVDQIPMRPQQEVKVGGYFDVGRRGTRGQLVAQGIYEVGPGVLADLAGVQMEDFVAQEARLTVNDEGVKLVGKTRTQFVPHVRFGHEVQVTVYFSWHDPADSYMEVVGEMVVAGTGLQPAVMRIDKRGVVVRGAFVTPISAIEMMGSITSQGPALRGTGRILFPLSLLDGAVSEMVREVERAQEDVDQLKHEIERQRKIVAQEREPALNALRKAQGTLKAAQARLRALDTRISAEYRSIAKAKRDISKKRRWSRKGSWWTRAWRRVKYYAYAAYKNVRIAGHYAAIGGLNVAKPAAQAALEVAKGAVWLAEQTVAATPIDLDPRVWPIITAHETAMLFLEGLRAPLVGLPIAEDFGGRIDLWIDIGGAGGEVHAVAGGVELAGGTVHLGAKPKACIDFFGLGEVCAPF